MRAAIKYSIRLATLAGLAAFGGLTHAWGQGCPASPNYSTDFTNNQACLALNGVNTNSPPDSGSPSFRAPATPQQSVTNVLSLTAAQGGWATSAWYLTPQAVASGFSTTFAFQIGGKTSAVNADGIAFLIQNSPGGTHTGLAALGPGGCGIGFGQSGSGCAPATGGIPNSVAIEFNTFNNGQGVDPSSDDVTIQNCGGSGANSVDQTCRLGTKDLSSTINLSDGNLHTATVTYTPTAAFGCATAQGCGTLDVLVDGVDLFPGGVPFDITTIGLNSSCSASAPAACTAYVGFTAGTGGDNDEQDIVNWTFTPAVESQSASGIVGPSGTTTTFNINGGFQAGSSTSGYDLTAQQTTTSQNLQMVVTAIPMKQTDCNALVQANQNFKTAQCFVYQNGGGQNKDASVLFEVTCSNASCGSSNNQFQAILGTDFNFDCSENVPLECGPSPSPFSFGFPNLTSSDFLPEIGFLKGEGPDASHPCTPYTNGTALFQSNQIQSFALGDTSGGAHAGSGGTTSCWTMTYLTNSNEIPTVSITQPANGALYLQGSATAANFACSAVNAGANSPVGPYLTVPTCTAADSPGGAVTNGKQFDTSTPGPHTFTVQAQDSATNTNQQSVSYTVVTGAAPASGTKCNGVYYGTFKGNITVLKGQSCTFISGGVTGSIAEFGGSLSLANATVGGGIGIIGGSYFIGPATIIKGDLAVLATPASALQNQVCGASIGGSLTFLANGSPVAIGSNSPVCPGNTIGGSLVVDLNFAATSIFDNTVGGSLLDQGNSQPTQVYSNHVSAALNCSGDKTITGGGNTAAKKQGQCATF